jgi:hypothetical protein
MSDDDSVEMEVDLKLEVGAHAIFGGGGTCFEGENPS